MLENLNDIEKILSYGYEKILFNSQVFENYSFVEKAIKEFEKFVDIIEKKKVKKKEPEDA